MVLGALLERGLWSSALHPQTLCLPTEPQTLCAGLHFGRPVRRLRWSEWDQLTPSSGMTATGGLLGSMDFASLRKGRGWKRLECVCVGVCVCG